MNILEKMWEDRSKKYGRSIEGVLPKSFPKPVNHYLDQWMFSQVASVIDKEKKIKILDLGCGYGRLSKKILDTFPNTETTGVDISEQYVKLYTQDLSPRGKAIKADINKLPFKNHSFDMVILVTTLMYVHNKEDHKKILTNIFKLLKPGGKFVIIERNTAGFSYITLGGLVTKLRGEKNREIPTFTFNLHYLTSLIRLCKGNLKSTEGVPVFTLFLPILIIIGFSNNKITEMLISVLKFIDKKFAKLAWPSVYISYIGNV